MRRLIVPLVAATTLSIFTCGQAVEPAPGKQVAGKVQLTKAVKVPESASNEFILEDETQPVKDDKPTTVDISYLLFVPEDYEDQEALPLLIFLHGKGECGDDLDLVKKWGPPRIVEEKPDFPFILVSPQCPLLADWDAELIVLLTERIAEDLKVDKQRIYITGLDTGGYGTWSVIAENNELYAAAVPICGGGNPVDAHKMTGIPIWAFHGQRDRVVFVQRSLEMKDAVTAAGGNVKLTIYPDAHHKCWPETYENPEVYKWLLSHKR